MIVFFFQAEDGIRDLVRSRGLGDVYKRQDQNTATILDFQLANGNVTLQSWDNETISVAADVKLSLIHI